MPPIGIASTSIPDDEGYTTVYLTGPYDGWVYNDVHRVRLNGQVTFQIQGDASSLTFDTPPDLQPDATE